MVLTRTYFITGLVVLITSFIPGVAGDLNLFYTLLLMAVVLFGFAGIDYDLEHLKSKKK